MLNSFVGSLHKHKVHFYSFYSQSQLHKRRAGLAGQEETQLGREKEWKLCHRCPCGLLSTTRFKETKGTNDDHGADNDDGCLCKTFIRHVHHHPAAAEGPGSGSSAVAQ